jgi:hypothetical protein
MTERMAACNRRLAQWRVTWLIELSASHQLLWCIGSFVLRNPPLRQAPKPFGRHNACSVVLSAVLALLKLLHPKPYVARTDALDQIFYKRLGSSLVHSGNVAQQSV